MVGESFVAVLMTLALAGSARVKFRYTAIIPENTLSNIPPCNQFLPKKPLPRKELSHEN